MTAPPAGAGGNGAPLIDAVREVLRMGVVVYRGPDPRRAELLRAHLARLDEPLRVAIAGKLKAGKSTLLNALVGEQIAPTDAGECTRVVTWYRDGPPRITLHPRDGEPVPVPVYRRRGALVLHLDGRSPEELDHIDVRWPAQHLRATTLVDTPGIASLSAGVSRRTVRFLQPDDDVPTEADAVVYLMRQLHATDARFLEAFHDQGAARAAAVNTIGVISRADEIGGGRVDAMTSARAVARRYRVEPALRGLCQDVVAVAGLLAQTARTIQHAEVAAIAELARAPRADLDAALLTTDRFLGPSGPGDRLLPQLSGPARRTLLDRFGVFGLRLATVLVRRGGADPAALAAELLRRSGLRDLESVLHTRFAERRHVFKARSALLALENALAGPPCDGSAELAARVERISAGTHEFAELRTLDLLRTGGADLPPELVSEAERLLGEQGAAMPVRLAVDAGAGPGAARAAALEALARWQELAEDPMCSRAAADVCRVVVRTCEGLLAGAAR